MRKATVFLVILAMFGLSSAWAQDTEYALEVPPSDDLTVGFSSAGAAQSGARAIAGPYDGDGDGRMEIYLSDYTAGGRVHVIENVGPDLWELVYSTPVLDSTATTNNIRAIAVGDMDNDGAGEIYFFGGRNYSGTNPSLPVGLYGFESVGDNDYGSAPATIYEFDGDLPDRWRQEQIAIMDIDNDLLPEMMFGNNGASNTYDNWYILSVSGDIGSGFEVWVQEARLSSRGSEDFDPVSRGGGSPYAIHAANLDGTGGMELVMHSWNNFNFAMGAVAGIDSYTFPDENAQNINLQAGTGDHVSLFGGVVVDINNDGDDEVFFPRFQSFGSAAVTIINYESGEDPLQITPAQVALDVIQGVASLGITAGDLDGDGQMELIGAGNSYTTNSFEAGNPPAWVNIAEWNGGADVELSSSYDVLSIAFPEDQVDVFNTVNRDSAGVMTTYLEDGPNGPEFVSKLTYLGDSDGDGRNEVALAFQGVDDSTFVYSEVFNPADSTYTRTTVSSQPQPNRVFMRVVQGGDGFAVDIQDERVIMPTDYVLEANYPNPFNPTTTIRFTLPIDKQVSVNVYDLQGRLVKSLVNNQLLSQGTHEVTWDATNTAGASVASGTYLYTLEYGNFRQAQQMVLIK